MAAASELLVARSLSMPTVDRKPSGFAASEWPSAGGSRRPAVQSEQFAAQVVSLSGVPPAECKCNCGLVAQEDAEDDAAEWLVVGAATRAMRAAPAESAAASRTTERPV